MSTQLFARIKRTSKYYTQNTFNGRQPVPFEVTVDPWNGEYCVIGNGNQYRIADVSLSVISDGREVKLA